MPRYLNNDCFNWALFAEWIGLARKGRGMSQKTVAIAMQKSIATISRWESGKIAPTLSDFLLLCWFYELEPMKFFVNCTRIQKTVSMFDGGITADESNYFGED